MKCVCSGYIKTSSPAIHTCKNCRQTWYSNQPVPECMMEIDTSENAMPSYIEKTAEVPVPKPVITFKQASQYVLPISDYKGQTLDRIAETDTGLKFLDWLGGARQESGQCTEIDDNLAVYLGDATIQKELERIYDEE